MARASDSFLDGTLFLLLIFPGLLHLKSQGLSSLDLPVLSGSLDGLFDCRYRYLGEVDENQKQSENDHEDANGLTEFLVV